MSKQNRKSALPDNIAYFLEASHIGVVRTDGDGIITYWNREAERIFEYTESEMLGRNCEILHPEKSREEYARTRDRAMQSHKTESDQFERITKSGKTKFVELYLNTETDRNGDVTGFTSFFADLTSQETVIRLLREQTEFLNSVAIVSHTDVEGNITYVNDQFCQVSQFTRRELIGKKHNIVNSNYHSESFWRTMWAVLESGKTWQGEIRNQKKDGTFYWVYSIISPRFDHNRNKIGFASVRIDVTKQKEAEQQIVHTQKLASIGELSAGVGHEINNPLAIANGNVAVIRMQLEKMNIMNEALEKAFAKYDTASKRIVDIVQGLRTYARSDEEDFSATEIRKSVEQVVSLVRDIYEKSGIQLETHYPDKNLFVWGNSGKLQQVVMNFLSNARDALKGVDNAKITVNVSHKNDKVHVSVTDNGCGIPDESKSKVFDSFFTTKRKGEGTGIGLSLSSTIINEHKGRILLDSKVGAGSTFTIVLNEHTEHAEKSGPVSETNTVSRQNLANKRILIVDDEELVREILRDILVDLGCIADEAEDGRVALNMLRETEYDVVISDVRMPHLSGSDLIKKARALHPERSTVYTLMSGDVNTDASAEQKASQFPDADYCIAKPFDESELTEILSASVKNTEKSAA